MTVLDNIENIMQYHSISYTSEQYLTIPDIISSLLSGLTSLAVLKLFCDRHRDPETQTDRHTSEL